jgi:hypothetical protein
MGSVRRGSAIGVWDYPGPHHPTTPARKVPIQHPAFDSRAKSGRHVPHPPQVARKSFTSEPGYGVRQIVLSVGGEGTV